MDECEALSDRLGIMVNGQFQCLGSVQQLKEKFGKGYTLILKCRHSDTINNIQPVMDFVQSKIKFATLKGKIFFFIRFKNWNNKVNNPFCFISDQQQETLFYQINKEDQSIGEESIQNISELFDLLESNKASLKLETYSLSQTSLEQVFLSFARHQKDEQTILAEAEQMQLMQAEGPADD